MESGSDMEIVTDSEDASVYKEEEMMGEQIDKQNKAGRKGSNNNKSPTKLQAFLQSLKVKDNNIEAEDTESGTDTDALSLYSSKETRSNLVRTSSSELSLSDPDLSGIESDDYHDRERIHHGTIDQKYLSDTERNTERNKFIRHNNSRPYGNSVPRSSGKVSFGNEEIPSNKINYFGTPTDDLNLNDANNDPNFLSGMPKPPPPEISVNRIMYPGPSSLQPSDVPPPNRIRKADYKSVKRQFSMYHNPQRKHKRLVDYKPDRYYPVDKTHNPLEEIDLRKVKYNVGIYDDSDVYRSYCNDETFDEFNTEDEDSLYYYSYDSEDTQESEESFGAILKRIEGVRIKKENEAKIYKHIEGEREMEEIDAPPEILREETFEHDLKRTVEPKKRVDEIKELKEESEHETPKIEREVVKKKTATQKKSKKKKKLHNKDVKALPLEKGQTESGLIDLDDPETLEKDSTREVRDDEEEEKVEVEKKKKKNKKKHKKKHKDKKKKQKKKKKDKAKKERKASVSSTVSFRSKINEDDSLLKDIEEDDQGITAAVEKQMNEKKKTADKGEEMFNNHKSCARIRVRLEELKKEAAEEAEQEAEMDENHDDLDSNFNAEGVDPEDETPEPPLGVQYDPEQQIALGDPISVGTSVWAVDFANDKKFRKGKIVAFKAPASYTVKFGLFRKQPGTQRLDIALRQPKSSSGLGIRLFKSVKDMYKACASGDVQTVLDNIQKNADIVDKSGGKLKEKPLYYAAKNGHVKVVKLLLRYGAEDEADGRCFNEATPEVKQTFLEFGYGKAGTCS